jgi:cytochrome c-type biogenesis protein CcmF
MRLGDKASIGDIDFRFIDLRNIQGPNYQAAQGWFAVTRHTQPVAIMKPEKRLFNVQQMPMTEAAIDRSVTRDLYVSLGEQTGSNSWQVRLQVKPFVGWIWAGCLLMALGGLLAASDRRYRIRVRS